MMMSLFIFMSDTHIYASSKGAITRALTNVAYANVSSAQVMDIYLPEGDGPFPVVVLIHGGAFKMGDKQMETSNAEALVVKGYAAASINYRLSNEAKFPAQIEDCKAAVRFLRANAAKFQRYLEPVRILLKPAEPSVSLFWVVFSNLLPMVIPLDMVFHFSPESACNSKAFTVMPLS